MNSLFKSKYASLFAFIFLAVLLSVLSFSVYSSIENQERARFEQERRNRISTASSFFGARLANVYSQLEFMEEVFIPPGDGKLDEAELRKIFERLVLVAPSAILAALDVEKDEGMLIVKKDGVETADAMRLLHEKLQELRCGGKHGISFSATPEHQYMVAALALRGRRGCLVAIMDIGQALKMSLVFAGNQPFNLLATDGRLLYSSNFEDQIGKNVRESSVPELKLFADVLPTIPDDFGSKKTLEVEFHPTEKYGLDGFVLWSNILTGAENDLVLIAYRPISLVSASLMTLRNWILLLTAVFLVIPGIFLIRAYVKKSGEARHTREVLDLFTQITGDSYWEYDLRNGQVFMSANSLELIGETNPVRMNKLQKYVHPEDIGNFLNEISGIFKKERDSVSFEWRLKSIDGSYKWLWERGRMVDNMLVGVGTNIDEHKSREHTLESLSEMLADISSYENIGEMMKALHEWLNEVVENDNFGVLILDYLGKDSLYDSRFFGEFVSLNDDFYASLKSGAHIFARAMDKGEPIISGDLSRERDIVLEFNKDARSALAIPIISQSGRKWGALGLVHMRKNAFDQKDTELMCLVASSVAAYLDESASKEDIKGRLQQREMESMVDALTKIWNRRYLEKRMEEETARIERGGGSACVCLGDVGEFKKVNDNYGHDVGDEVLKAIAQAMSSNIRETDVAARLGGDEFVLLFSNMDEDEVEKTLERIKKSLEETQIFGTLQSGAKEKIKILIDFGTKFYPDGKSNSLSEVMKLADEDMYEKKQARKRANNIPPR